MQSGPNRPPSSPSLARCSRSLRCPLSNPALLSCAGGGWHWASSSICCSPSLIWSPSAALRWAPSPSSSSGFTRVSSAFRRLNGLFASAGLRRKRSGTPQHRRIFSSADRTRPAGPTSPRGSSTIPPSTPTSTILLFFQQRLTRSAPTSPATPPLQPSTSRRFPPSTLPKSASGSPRLLKRRSRGETAPGLDEGEYCGACWSGRFERRKIWQRLPRETRERRVCILSCSPVVSSPDKFLPVVDAAFGEILTTCEKLRWLIANTEDSLRPERRPTNLILAHKVSKVVYEPLGVVAACVSWNYPLHNALGPIIASLAAGNAIVVKPSELVAWSSLIFVQAVRDCLEACGEDPELVQVVVTLPETVEALTGDPRIKHITFVRLRSLCCAAWSLTRMRSAFVDRLGGGRQEGRAERSRSRYARLARARWQGSRDPLPLCRHRNFCRYLDASRLSGQSQPFFLLNLLLTRSLCSPAARTASAQSASSFTRPSITSSSRR